MTKLDEAIEKATITKVTSGHGESEPCIQFTWGDKGHAEAILQAARAYREMQSQWMTMETAPKDDTLFLCRKKSQPHVTFEASMFWDQESWEIPEKYLVCQNMTTDEPLDDDFEDLEWRPLPQPPHQGETK